LALNVYEGMFILDSNRYGRDQDGVSGQVPQMIEKLGGELLVSRLWEERRLAFPIKNQRKGTYWLTYFRLDASQLTTVRRQCEINENILRFLVLKVDPRIVDALVAHAQAAPVPAVAPVVEEVAAVAAVAAIPAEELAEVPDAIADLDDE
jgi:small subunit ribosomal protein S6